MRDMVYSLSCLNFYTVGCLFSCHQSEILNTVRTVNINHHHTLNTNHHSAPSATCGVVPGDFPSNSNNKVKGRVSLAKNKRDLRFRYNASIWLALMLRSLKRSDKVIHVARPLKQISNKIMAATARTNNELKRKANSALSKATDPKEKLRLACLSRGASGIKGLGR